MVESWSWLRCWRAATLRRRRRRMMLKIGWSLQLMSRLSARAWRKTGVKSNKKQRLAQVLAIRKRDGKTDLLTSIRLQSRRRVVANCRFHQHHLDRCHCRLLHLLHLLHLHLRSLNMICQSRCHHQRRRRRPHRRPHRVPRPAKSQGEEKHKQKHKQKQEQTRDSKWKRRGNLPTTLSSPPLSNRQILQKKKGFKKRPQAL
mmetsp:Transcript_22781/g.50145  ORF Transcript_22781/g.50145 Transcript_22781/m.50145 type:complete len:201 (+) Transcript_22781:789-1391(+)